MLEVNFSTNFRTQFYPPHRPRTSLHSVVSTKVCIDKSQSFLKVHSFIEFHPQH